MPAVSVLLSVRNGMPYLPLTVESLLRQTHRDFELVVVDNLSSDGSRDYIEQQAAADPRIRYFPNERDLGHSGGLNRGLSLCRAPWVARIDADDVALPERLERQLAFLRDNPDVKLSSCLAYYIDPGGRRVGKTEHPVATREVFRDFMARNEMIGLLHPGAIYDRELVTGLGGYRPAFGAANDMDLWSRIAETGCTVLVQQERLMEYRVHPDQLSVDFMKARRSYEWARECSICRRAGKPEPTEEEFLESWRTAPLLRRMNRARKTYAKASYRNGGLLFASRHRLRALVNFGMALLLQPTYAIGRLRKQLLR